MSLTTLRVELLLYAEIKYFDWLKIVMLQGTANQSALLQCSYAILKLVYDISLSFSFHRLLSIDWRLVQNANKYIQRPILHY